MTRNAMLYSLRCCINAIAHLPLNKRFSNSLKGWARKIWHLSRLANLWKGFNWSKRGFWIDSQIKQMKENSQIEIWQKMLGFSKTEQWPLSVGSWFLWKKFKRRRSFILFIDGLAFPFMPPGAQQSQHSCKHSETRGIDKQIWHLSSSWRLRKAALEAD